ncbi:MAG: hypothetical protein M1368_06625 [Thaumarchaeota archaeon]|nr:hypothetical protein [Nitrososphaerota archaeon]
MIYRDLRKTGAKTCPESQASAMRNRFGGGLLTPSNIDKLMIGGRLWVS